MRALLAFALLASGCTNQFPDYSQLHSLSVLAVRAEPPEIAPGEQTRLDALVYEPTGGVTPTITWAACTLFPPASSGKQIADECVTQDSAPYLIPLGAGPSATFTMPSLAPQDLGFPDDTGGLYVPVRAVVSDGSARVVAIYRLRFHVPQSPLPPNRNPRIADLVANDGTPFVDGWTVQDGNQVNLRADAQPGSAESYVTFDVNTRMTKQVTETLRVSWFVTAGHLSEDHTADGADTTWSVDQWLPLRGSELDVYTVIRDERGGVDFTRRMLTLQ